ncbi:hypothetical protein VTH06DRAFT_5025 [Thermothelomyces fergusii]
MSGTVLSTLCSICRTEPPKYRCPRCGVRTCSLPCVQKHKVRADCDGVRNPRAFMPLKQLKTPAGVDHDYNFLTSIERARERAEKEVLEARRLLSEKELRPKNEDKVFQKVWYGDELRHIPMRSQPYRKPEGPVFIDGFDKHVRRRLRYLHIDAVTMPKGMARQKENKTAWNRRTQSINWQVEWLVYNTSDLGFTSAQHGQQPLRVLCKTLEGTALHTGLASALDWYRGQLDRQSREQPDPAESDNEADSDDAPPAAKKRKTRHNNKNQFPTFYPVQDPLISTWGSAPYSLQYQPTTAWSQTTIHPHAETTLEEQLMAWDFYLVNVVPPQLAGIKTAMDDAKGQTKKKGGKTIIQLSSTECLTTALAGRKVVEFPTVVAVPGGWGPPAGYTVEPDERPDWVREAARRAARAHRGHVNDAGMSADTGNTDDAGEALPRSGPAKRPRRHGAGDAGGRGGKRFKSSPGRAAALSRAEFAGKQQQQQQQSSDDEDGAEEGEINSDGDEVMDDAADVNGSAEEADDSDWEDEHGSTTAGREDEGEQPQQQEETRRETGRPRGGGLVDYGSSEESE